MGRLRNITAHKPSPRVGHGQVLIDRISRRRAPCTISYLAVPLGRGPPDNCTLNLDWGLLLVPTHLDNPATSSAPANTGIRLARRLPAGTEGHSPLTPLSPSPAPVVATERTNHTTRRRLDPVSYTEPKRTDLAKAVYLALVRQPSCASLPSFPLLHHLRLGPPPPAETSGYLLPPRRPPPSEHPPPQPVVILSSLRPVDNTQGAW